MARIAINGMEFFSHHGCFKEEQQTGTYFQVDLALHVDVSKAEVSDHLSDTINYVEVFQLVKREMAISSKLLEHVVRRILDALFVGFPEVQKIEIELFKMNPPLGGKMASVSVATEESRS